MSTANERQVGGDHYKTGGIELWELFGPAFLMGYAAKYVSRWRKKAGVQDLEKALHVCEKLREVIAGSNYYGGGAHYLTYAPDLIAAWSRNSGMNWVEQTIVRKIMYWEKSGDIDEAIAGIHYLIENEVPDDLETEAQIAARERRVPRFAAGGTITPPTFEHSVPGNEDGNDAVATAMRVNTTPWVVDEDWLGRSGIGNDLIDRFWTKRAKNLYVLDPHVVSTNIPRTVRHCYAARSDGNWTLEMRVCPTNARAYFPSIPLSQNMKEWEERPEWQRVLYAWSAQESKYKLSERTEAWHYKEEEE